ncbi:44682_t:CDS:2, partial [Gigaspora margarita]
MPWLFMDQLFLKGEHGCQSDYDCADAMACNNYGYCVEERYDP